MKIAGIARDRRHRRNLFLPITAITRDYGDLGDFDGENAWKRLRGGKFAAKSTKSSLSRPRLQKIEIRSEGFY